MVVTRDLGLEHEYQGVVEILSGEIDLDLERYLGNSEQLPSALVCEVVLDAHDQVLRCAGVLCQTFPEADPASLDPVRSNLRGTGMVDLLRQDRTPREIMGFALLGREFRAVDATTLQFRCTCDPQRALAVVSTLGAQDVEALAREPGATEVRCSFCGGRYDLSRDELLALAERLRRERS
jgi:molecular chaperone Hsp33